MFFFLKTELAIRSTPESWFSCHFFHSWVWAEYSYGRTTGSSTDGAHSLPGLRCAEGLRFNDLWVVRKDHPSLVIYRDGVLKVEWCASSPLSVIGLLHGKYEVISHLKYLIVKTTDGGDSSWKSYRWNTKRKRSKTHHYGIIVFSCSSLCYIVYITDLDMRDVYCKIFELSEVTFP